MVLGTTANEDERHMTIRKNISAPADWWDAFRAQADKDGVESLAEWLAEAGKSKLPKRVQAKLSERPPAHRPKNSGTDS